MVGEGEDEEEDGGLGKWDAETKRNEGRAGSRGRRREESVPVRQGVRVRGVHRHSTDGNRHTQNKCVYEQLAPLR